VYVKTPKSITLRVYYEVGFESRQVIDFEISTLVTEYRAQILEDKNGKQYVKVF